MENDEEYLPYYRWGFSLNNEDQPNGWFIRADVLDNGWYAVAYYSLDDDNPRRFYESNNQDLLRVLLDEIDEILYFKCLEEKNMYLESCVEIEEMTTANFM